MAIPAILLPLLSQGLNLLGNAVLAKGKGWVEEKTGIKLDQPLSAEDTLKLRQFEMDHQEELLKLRHEENKLDAELEKAYLEDKQSARNMQIAALQQNDIFSKRFIYYFAIGWSLASASYIAAITFGNIPADNIRFADTILGFLLGTLISTIVQFFYGSSSSSRNKDESIKSMISEISGGSQK